MDVVLGGNWGGKARHLDEHLVGGHQTAPNGTREQERQADADDPGENIGNPPHEPDAQETGGRVEGDPEADGDDASKAAQPLEVLAGDLEGGLDDGADSLEDENDGGPDGGDEDLENSLDEVDESLLELLLKLLSDNDGDGKEEDDPDGGQQSHDEAKKTLAKSGSMVVNGGSDSPLGVEDELLRVVLGLLEERSTGGRVVISSGEAHDGRDLGADERHGHPGHGGDAREHDEGGNRKQEYGDGGRKSRRRWKGRDMCVCL